MPIHGTNNAETIQDTVGKSDIYAYGGNDLIIAAAEQEIEIIDGGAGSDTISYVNVNGVWVDIGNVTQGYGFSSTYDTLWSIENVIGSKYADEIYGSDGANELFGLAGNDFLEGRGGADKLDGGSGFDTASYQSSNAAVSVNLTTGLGQGGHAAGDRLYSIERVIGSQHDDVLTGNQANNVLEGGGGADFLQGQDGRDKLLGGAGDDWLYGGRGGDTLTGGGGADTFVFVATSDSYFLLGRTDVITDFNHSAGDRIDLSAIDAKLGTAGNQAFSYIGANAFSAEGQVRAYASNGDMVVEVNNSGASGAEMTIVVADIATLVSGDFIL